MKKIIFGVMFTLLLSVFNYALAPENTYRNTFSGGEVTAKKAPQNLQGAPGSEASVSFSCETTGDLPKLFTFTVFYNKDNNTIFGGEWKLLVSKPDENGNPVEKGSIWGTISGGSVSVENGKVISIYGTRLIIGGGDGNYANASGSGDLSGNLDVESRKLNGGMSLTF